MRLVKGLAGLINPENLFPDLSPILWLGSTIKSTE